MAVRAPDAQGSRTASTSNNEETVGENKGTKAPPEEDQKGHGSSDSFSTGSQTQGGRPGNALLATLGQPSSVFLEENTDRGLDTTATLRPGTSGPPVEKLQSALVEEGFLDEGEVDGSYGPRTTQAVRDFQASRGLAEDGIAGPNTATALNGGSSAPVEDEAAAVEGEGAPPEGVDEASGAAELQTDEPSASDKGYSKVYVLTKEGPEDGGVLSTGHAVLAFGDDSGPKEVFNQAGTDGPNPLFGDSASISRLSWEGAKEHLFDDGAEYFVHDLQVPPDQIDQMYSHANEVFMAGEATDNPETRKQDYHAMWDNCATFTKDVLLAGGMDIDSGIYRPRGLREALDQQVGREEQDGGDDGIEVNRSFLLHGRDGLADQASPWTEDAEVTPSTDEGGVSSVGSSSSQGYNHQGEPVPPKVNLDAPIVLEYHAVNVDGGTATASTGATVSIDHLENIASEVQDSENPNDFLFTFDDGYRDNYEAFKALQERGINLRGVVSVISDATRDSGEADAMDSHLSKPELKEMADAGWEIALHSKNSVDHALGFTRFADAAATGQLTTRDGGTVDLADDQAALDALKGWRGTTDDAAAMDTLRDLQRTRATVVERQGRGSESIDESVTAAMTDYFRHARDDLSEESGIPQSQITTIIWPHSQSDARVWEAASNAGFEHGFGGPGGDPANPMDRQRTWMNDSSDLP